VASFLNGRFSLRLSVRHGGNRHGRQVAQDQGRVREEAERHEQGAPEAAVGAEGARPAAEEPVAVREAAEEAAGGRGGDEEDEGAGVLNFRGRVCFGRIYFYWD